ncbi:hypothetical protein BH11MYX4_BH11MYX4_34860 [soil metagenome]
MAYREPPLRPPVVSRRLVADDAFRWLKLLLGLPMLGGALFLMWNGKWNSLECTNTACVVRYEYLLRSTDALPFDATRPPEVVVLPAKVGKSGEGKKLVLRYTSGVEVELARDFGTGVEAHAARWRAYVLRPVGTFSLQQPHSVFPVVLAGVMGWLGLLMALDALTLLGWRRIRSDGQRHLLSVDRVILGVPVKRETFRVTAATTVGRAPFSPRNERIAWLTLETPGAPPQRLPMLDRPRARTVVEEMLANA